ncbi:MAG: tyrosine-type recombinase/integrase [bacterium]|nr:tyrosine-type recombinase/integrase [bacterium]
MDKSKKPLPSHLQDFLDWIDVEKGLSPKSQENYSRFLKRFFDWLKIKKLEELKPHELTREHVFDYRLFLSRSTRSARTNEPLKKSTQNYYLIALRMFLSFFAHRNFLSLPVEKVPLARDKSERHVRFMELEQLEKLFEAPDITTPQGIRDRSILETFFSTGLRISELVALNADQIKIGKGGREVFELSIQGKGGRIRTVYFSLRALLWLEKYMEVRSDTHPALFVAFGKNGKKISRLTSRSIEKSFKHYIIKAGLPLIMTPHAMRHSFGTNLLKNGVDLRVIQEFLGHKNIAATQMYAHVTSKQLKDIHKNLHGKK